MDKISYQLGQRPGRLLLITTLFLIPILSYFAIFPFEVESDVRRGFAQKDGRSMQELKSFAEFYNVSNEGLEVWAMLILPKSDSAEEYIRITQEVLNEVSRLDQFVQNFSVLLHDKTIHFSDTAGPNLNYLFDWYKYAHEMSSLVSMNLSFPVGNALGHDFFLGTHFFGVNTHQASEYGPIETVKYISLWYMSEAGTPLKKKQLESVQMGLFNYCQRDDFSPLISFQMYGDQVANAEMLRGTMFTVKLFIIGVIMMIAFILFSFQHLTFRSQIIMMIAAIASPTLATIACFAILGWTSTTFNSIMCITPFLVMGIGVDDAFLLLHCWKRKRTLGSDQQTIQAVLLEIGPSMAITSVTNTLAFGIGMTSTTPQMSAFCLCTAMAVLLDFFFEFLIFVPVMVLYYEEKDQKHQSTQFESITWKQYTRIILSPCGKAMVMTTTVLLYITASMGVYHMSPSFDPSKTFPMDSHLLTALRNFEIIQSEYSPINFISKKLPDLRDDQQVKDFFEMIDKLENKPYCYGSERTQLLLRDYMKSVNYSDVNYEAMPLFIEERMIADKNIIQYRLENGSVSMEGMNYIVICRGSPSWNERAYRLDAARQIIDSYPQFQTSLFDYDSTIYDLIIGVKTELLKAVLLTFVCMTIACAFMIPSVVGVSIASLSMLSISYSMFHYLSFSLSLPPILNEIPDTTSLLGWLSIWGQDLDPVTMINVLMAIGFSVDFSAHVCYHFHLDSRSPINLTTHERIEKILTSVGRPMMEASMSTLICMIPLFFVPVYIIQSFARTVCLVACFGLFHGILLIPVLLSYFCKRKTLTEHESETMLTS